jgi:hypothetical protein
MFPTKINICGIPFKIVLCKDNFVSDTIHFGEIDYKKCEIHIDAEMPIPLKEQTLIHEWLHGVLFMIGQDEPRANEQLVQGIAMAIYQTFRLNESEGE